MVEAVIRAPPFGAVGETQISYRDRRNVGPFATAGDTLVIPTLMVPASPFSLVAVNVYLAEEPAATVAVAGATLNAKS